MGVEKTEHWKVMVALLEEIAKTKGITQQEISDLTGLKQPNVSRIFALRYKPKLDMFLKIAQAVRVNFYFEDKDGTTDLNILFEQAMSKIGRRDNKYFSES